MKYDDLHKKAAVIAFKQFDFPAVEKYKSISKQLTNDERDDFDGFVLDICRMIFQFCASVNYDYAGEPLEEGHELAQYGTAMTAVKLGIPKRSIDKWVNE